MQRFSKTEIEWLNIAIEHYIKELEETMSQEDNGTSIALCNLRREQMTILRSKLTCALHDRDRRIEITY